MQFMAVFHFAPEGGGPYVAARWQHGPTPGVTVHSAWVSNSVPWGDTDEALESGRTFIAFDADTPGAVAQFVNYLQLVSSKIEVWPVTDYMPAMRAYESGDTGQWEFPSGVPQQQRARQLELFKQYQQAATTDEAVEMWRESGVAAGTAIRTARRRQEGGAW